MEFTYSKKQLKAYNKSLKNFNNLSTKVSKRQSLINRMTKEMTEAKGSNVMFLGEKLIDEITLLTDERLLENKLEGLHDVHKLIQEGHTYNINLLLPKYQRDVTPMKVEVILNKSYGEYQVGVKYEMFLTIDSNIKTSCRVFDESPTGFISKGRKIRHRHISFISNEKYIEKQWKTFSGALIPASQMSHQHLSNIHYYFKIFFNRTHAFAFKQLEERFNGELLPYRPTIDFRSEIEGLVEFGYTDGKPNSPIIVNGVTIGNVRYD